MKSIFIVENEIHVKDALCLLIEHQGGLEIVGTADHNSCILAEVCKAKPDVILLDWYLPGIDAERLLKAIRRCCPSILIIATSVRPEHEKIAMNMGTDSFLLKQLPPDQFIKSMNIAINKQRKG